MTIQEAKQTFIDRGLEIIEGEEGMFYNPEKWREAVTVLTEMFKQEPCEDAISRAEAIRIASGYCHPSNIPKELEKLPSVLPEPKTGHWIPCTVSSGRDSWECSECGRRARGKIKNLPFCHCGAKMNVEDDSEVTE